MKRKGRISIVLVGISLLLFACGKAPFYTKTFSFEGNEWEQPVKPKFVVTIEDTSAFYEFILTLRTTTDYRYNNLWIYWNTVTPDEHTPNAREPFEFKIQAPTGEWYGKESGTIVENQLIFNRRKFPFPGKYTFMMEQGITESEIDEVLDIGLTIEKLKE